MAPVYDIAQRAQALTLKINGFSNAAITEQTGISARGVQDLFKRARDRGFDPQVSKIIRNEYIIDAPRSGRPRKDTERKADDAPDIETRDGILANAPITGNVGTDMTRPESILFGGEPLHVGDGGLMAGTLHDGELQISQVLPQDRQPHHDESNHVQGTGAVGMNVGISDGMLQHPMLVVEQVDLRDHSLAAHSGAGQGLSASQTQDRMAVDVDGRIDPSLGG